jgi:hypothetical protein
LTPEQEERLWPLMEEWFGERVEEMRALFDQFDENHPQDQPHFYLSWWATHRDHAGRGLGSVLINENLAAIDATGLPCFLESTNPVNLPKVRGARVRVSGRVRAAGRARDHDDVAEPRKINWASSRQPISRRSFSSKSDAARLSGLLRTAVGTGRLDPESRDSAYGIQRLLEPDVHGRCW